MSQFIRGSGKGALTTKSVYNFVKTQKYKNNRQKQKNKQKMKEKERGLFAQDSSERREHFCCTFTHQQLIVLIDDTYGQQYTSTCAKRS